MGRARPVLPPDDRPANARNEVIALAESYCLVSWNADKLLGCWAHARFEIRRIDHQQASHGHGRTASQDLGLKGLNTNQSGTAWSSAAPRRRGPTSERGFAVANLICASGLTKRFRLYAVCSLKARASPPRPASLRSVQNAAAGLIVHVAGPDQRSRLRGALGKHSTGSHPLSDAVGIYHRCRIFALRISH